MCSLVFLIYYNPMFILGCYHVMSCPDVSIGRFYNVNKSCQVIVGNPPIDQGLNSPQFRGTRVIRLSYRGHPQQGFSHAEISINRELDSLFRTHLIHTQVQCIVEEEKDTGERGKSLLLLGDCLTVFGFQFDADSILEEVAGFFPFMVSSRKNTLFIVYCV